MTLADYYISNATLREPVAEFCVFRNYRNTALMGLNASIEV